MYTKDKSTRITLRLNQDQFDFVKMNAEQLGVSPSEFLRMVVNSSMFAYRKMNESDKLKEAVEDISKKAKSELEGIGRENDEADKHNIV